MAFIAEVVQGGEGWRYRAFVVRFRDPIGRMKAMSFRCEANANDFLARVQRLEERWKSDRLLRKMEADNGVGR